MPFASGFKSVSLPAVFLVVVGSMPLTRWGAEALEFHSIVLLGRCVWGKRGEGKQARLSYDVGQGCLEMTERSRNIPSYRAIAEI